MKVQISQLKSKWVDLDHRRQYYFAYTFLFIIVCFGVFIWYFVDRRTFVWEPDGWNQHYRALVYFGKYLRSIVKNLLFNGRLVIPAWNFNIGEGGDILTALHYYVIGDPLNLLSLIVPTKYMWMLYDFLILLRLYLSGIAFSLLCFQTGQKNQYGIVAGALSYAFCSWAILNAARHPYFLNPMIYLPLLIMGIEKVICRERPWLLVGAVFVSAVSNFYFFYMLVLTIIIYTVIRLVLLYKKKIREIIAVLIYIGLFSLMGTLLASAVLLPVMATLLGGSRMATENGTLLFYPISYYSQLFSVLITTSSSYWLYMGYSVTVIPALFLLFRKRKQYTLLKTLFVVGVIFILFPSLGQMMNGFSYITNRWCWAFALLCSYIFAVMWPSLMNLTGRDIYFLVCCTMGYLSICLLLEYSRTAATFFSCAIIFVALFFLTPLEEMGKPIFSLKYRQKVILALSILSIFVHSFFLNAYSTRNYSSESKMIEEISELTKNETEAVKYAADLDGVNEFYRYSGRTMTANAGMSSNISSSYFCWSLGNSYVADFRSRLGMRQNMTYMYSSYDDRSALLSLASIRYFVLSSADGYPPPYGFTYVATVDIFEAEREAALDVLKEELGTDELTEDQIVIITNAVSTEYNIYRNDYVLPLAYTYETSFSEGAWNCLNEVERQETFLRTVVVADEAANEEDADLLGLLSEAVDYTITCNSREITQQGNSFVVTAANASATLTFEGLENSETYFVINGLEYDGASTYELYFGDESVDPLNLYNETRWNLLPETTKKSYIRNKIFWMEPTNMDINIKSSTGISKALTYYTPYYSFYSNRHNFAINLDYKKEAVTSITITFPFIGTYSFDTISVICQPMDSYAEQVSALSEDSWDCFEIGIDSISGTIKLEKDKWLCFSIPYSTGWKAFVDGEKAELYQANIQYMAIPLTEGEHAIELIYETPFLKEGICIFTFVLLGFIGIVILYQRRKNNSLFLEQINSRRK